MSNSSSLNSYFSQIQLPQSETHKGQNGKVLIIGGSELFHAASKWSLDIASKFADMVFYTSVPSNNHLIEQAKQNFWNGIVIDRKEVESYIEEADVILIGPGMTREKYVSDTWIEQPTANFDWNKDTYAVTNYLLSKYPHKKWVIDAGALQMLEPRLLTTAMILTPHRRELEMVLSKVKETQFNLHWIDEVTSAEEGSVIGPEITQQALELTRVLQGVTLLIKGHRDIVISDGTVEVIDGGNAGMTKGGTGDVLAGLVAALYAAHNPTVAAVIASSTNKQAGDELYKKVGPYFNASDLVAAIPEVLWATLLSSTSI